MIDRQRFFAEVRAAYGPLSQKQVDGFNIIIGLWEPAHSEKDVAQLAYILATAWHETATRMEPVIETRRANEETNPSVDTAIHRLESSWRAGKMPWVKKAYWKKDAKGLSWLGRGYPQCTGRPNYYKCEKALGVPFTKNPELMLQADPAARAMIHMMDTGGYTGKKLSDYFGPGKANPKGARRIINAQERAALVASHWTVFLHALT